MRTTHSLTVCHACPSATHTRLSHMPPPMHAPLPQMPLPWHTPCHACPSATHTPCQACPPPPYMPPPHMPPMHTPWHAYPHHHACPPAMHAPSPRGQNSWHMLLKILPCPNFVAGGKNESFTIVRPVRQTCSSDILRTQCCLILYVQLGFLQLSQK